MNNSLSKRIKRDKVQRYIDNTIFGCVYALIFAGFAVFLWEYAKAIN